MKREGPSDGRPVPEPGRALRDDACPSCGTAMVEARATLSLPVSGEDVQVPDAAHLRCPECGEIVLRYRDASRLGQDAVEIYRRERGLLSAHEIRAIREGFDLTQAEFGRLLRLGPNTISRWEASRNAQSAAMDLLLRMVRDVPGNVEYLRRQAA